MAKELNTDEKVFLLNKYVNEGCSEKEAITKLKRTISLMVPVVGMII